jgi:hypothetical protein
LGCAGSGRRTIGSRTGSPTTGAGAADRGGTGSAGMAAGLGARAGFAGSGVGAGGALAAVATGRAGGCFAVGASLSRRGAVAAAATRTICDSTTTSLGPPIIRRCSTLSRRTSTS